jgi:acyl-homoserine lactone synthase
MTKTIVIRPKDHRQYADLIEESFRIRYKIFVEERGWRELDRGNSREFDEYDDPSATYVFAIDGERIVGGQRFYPTTQPHMISEVFPHLVTNGSVPMSPVVMEWTRYFVVKERRMGRTDAYLLAAMQQFMLDEGMDEASAIAEMWWLPRLQHYGFEVRPLGLPQMVGGQWTMALTLKVSEETLQHILGVSRVRPEARGAVTHWASASVASANA